MIAHSPNRQESENRRPEEIESDLDRTRAEVSSTIDAIQSKLTPGQLMDQAYAYARSSLPADFSANLSHTVRDNPVPVVLVGVGLAWLMASNQRARAPADVSEGRMHRTASALSETGHKLKDRASELGHRISDSAASATDRASELSHRSQEQYYRAREGVSHMIEEQPLVLGVMGVALGTLLGAMLPGTRREDEMMGHTRDDLLEKAKQTASEQASRVQQSARHVAEVAKEEGRAVANEAASSARTPGDGHAQEPAEPVSANASKPEGVPGQHGYH